jgi:hypothetical protein
LVRTDAFVRGRQLTSEEVIAINLILKSRARKYVAAANPEWLFPERRLQGSWEACRHVLLPRDRLWEFGGEIFVGYKDGSTHYQDEFGRTSKLHESLRKTPPNSDPQPEDACGCGSGRTYGECCQEIPAEQRPSWSVLGVRERNLILCSAVARILGLREGKTWEDVRRELSDDHVKQIHDVFASLWPEGTQLSELLPRPRRNIVRAVLMGALDPRALPLHTTAWLSYFDELILPHPFLNAARLKPEYSPSASPRKFREQTLHNVFMLLALEPHIFAGTVHLLPDPADLDDTYRQEVWPMAEARAKELQFSDEDEQFIKALSRDKFMRSIKRLPDGDLLAFLQRDGPIIPADELSAVIALWKRELQEDPLALLQPIEPGEAGAQVQTTKSFNLETAMFLASLSGSLLYSDMDVMWNQICEPDGERRFDTASAWGEVLQQVGSLDFPLYPNGPSAVESLPAVHQLRSLIQTLVSCATERSSPDQVQRLVHAYAEDQTAKQERHVPHLIGRLQLAVPQEGFMRNEVVRLLLTFGRAIDARPISLAARIRWRPATAPAAKP